LLLSVVLIVGLAAGAGIAYLRHMMRPVFSSERSLAEITGLPVLGGVVRTFEEKYRARLRAGLLRYSVAAGLLLVGFMTALLAAVPASRFLRHYLETLS
jgi:predicted DNA-binding protein (UPF0278 family)